MQKQVLFQPNTTVQAMAAVRRSLRRLTGYGTDFTPSDLSYLIDIAESVDGIVYKTEKGNVVQYNHPQYHHNRPWLKSHILGCIDAYDNGHTASRLKFSSDAQAKEGAARLGAIRNLGRVLKKMVTNGERIDYTTDDQYRERGCRVVSSTGISNGYTYTATYAIPFDEARLQEQLKKQNLQKEKEAEYAALVAQEQASYSEAAVSYSEAAENTRKGEEDLKVAAEHKQEREKITAQTNTSKTLRIVGVVAIVVCVLVAVLLLVKRMKK